jgi:hypothetical protein
MRNRKPEAYLKCLFKAMQVALTNLLTIDLMNNSLISVQNLSSIPILIIVFFQLLSLRTADGETWNLRGEHDGYDNRGNISG